MHFRSIAIVVVAATLLAGQLARAELRTWTSASGASSMEAELVRVAGESVVLKTKEGKEITVKTADLSKLDREFIIRNSNIGADDPAAMRIPPMPSARVEIKLPGEANRMRVGGGGRYLIFRIKDKSKLAVVDLYDLSVVKEIDAPPDCAFAANRDKLFIARSGQQLLQRIDLRSMQSEKTVTLPDGDPVENAVMGYDGNGPLGLVAKEKLYLWDAETLQPMRINGPQLGGVSFMVSADGRVFSGWGRYSGNFSFMRVERNNTVIGKDPDGWSYNGSWAIPNADGSLFLTTGGLYSADLEPVPAGELEKVTRLPCVDSRFTIGVRGVERDKSEVAIYTTCDRRKIYSLPNPEHVAVGIIGTEHGRLHDEMRVHYLPHANRIALVPAGGDRVVVHQLDLVEEIKKRGGDYLHILSNPPSLVGIGDKYRYQIDALSSAGGVNYELVKGPAGVVVESGGLVRWAVPKARLGVKEPMVVAVRDKQGREVFHSWDVILFSQTPILHRLRPSATEEVPAGSDFRTWSDTSGQFNVDAEFVRMVQGRVTLKTRDGRFLTMRLQQLSEKDQAYVREKVAP